MIPLYSSKRTSVKLTPDKTIIKTTIKPSNEKEHEIHNIAYTLDIAPKIIRHSFNKFEKLLTIEMEYVNGVSLDNYIKQPNADKKLVKRAMFVALNKLYNNGIDHRDLCSENIIVVVQNDKLSVKILDYGDAKLYPEPIPLRLRDYSVFGGRNW